MGSSPYSVIKNKHGDEGIKRILAKYKETDMLNSFQIDVKPNGKIDQLKTSAYQDINKAKEELRNHFKIKKDWINTEYKGQLEKAVSNTKQTDQQLLGLTEEIQKLDKQQEKIQHNYEQAVIETRRALNDSSKTGIEEFDTLPEKYKQDVIQEGQKNFGDLTKSQIMAQGKDYYLNKFKNIFELKDLKTNVENSKGIITKKTEDLVGVGCCPRCSSCCSCHCCCCP